ncbi:MAG: MerR family transcriptional regulator [Calditrichia bacterium]
MRIKMPNRRLLYPLREVVKMTGLSDAEIKRWEEEFPQLKPVRNRAANRNYTERDLKLIFYIRDLMYVHKLDYAAVREKLKNYNPAEEEKDIVELKQLLAEIRMELKEIRQLLAD